MTVEQAVVTKLGGDATLTTLAPGGVWLDVAPQSATSPYVIVGLQAHIEEVGLGEARLFETAVLLVKAVGDGSGAAAALAAADRIDALLHAGTLTVTSATLMSMTRSERVRFVEVDGDVRYQHAGGLYEVVVSR